MSTPLKIPYIAERFIGVTIPDGGVMYACSYEGLHKLLLGNPVRIETDKEGSEDYDILKSKGEALGIFGGAPILQDAQTLVSYSFDPRAEVQEITVLRAGKSEVLRFETFSGDWFFASLSKCGKFLLLAEPYVIEIREIA